jgi:peptidoglycan/xylan/chitin deacetylase (PgdA/CDA1 family)
MSCLADNFRVVSMSEVLAAIIEGAPLPPKSVLVTFDDAYQDFAEHAWPIKKRYSLPVTLFVPTAFPDQPQQTFWWDRLYAAIRRTTRQGVDTSVGFINLETAKQKSLGMRKLTTAVKAMSDDEAQHFVKSICTELELPPTNNPVLGWEALRKLAAEGVTLAPHTRKHPLLSRVNGERAQEEISGAIVDLQREIGDVLPVLAYPSGAYDRQVVQMLPSLGIKLAFTTWRGLNDLTQIDPLRIRRLNIGRRTSPALMRTQLLPLTVHLNRWLPLPDAN